MVISTAEMPGANFTVTFSGTRRSAGTDRKVQLTAVPVVRYYTSLSYATDPVGANYEYAVAWRPERHYDQEGTEIASGDYVSFPDIENGTPQKLDMVRTLPGAIQIRIGYIRPIAPESG